MGKLGRSDVFYLNQLEARMTLRHQQREFANQNQFRTDRELQGLARDRDRFNFKQYVDVLEERIRNTETPSTIGIMGSWGSGKSSLMKLLKEKIEPATHVLDSTRSEKFIRWIKRLKERLIGRRDEDRVKTIWIDVWELGTQEEVWHAFLQAIFNNVYEHIPLRHKIEWRKLGDQAIRSSWRVLVVAAPVVAAILLKKSETPTPTTWQNVINVITFQSGDRLGVLAGVTTQIIALFALYKPAWDAVRKSIKFDIRSVLKVGSYQAQISELMKLRQHFESVVKLAVGEKGRIVVFIDDLDRCGPDKVSDVLDAIKLFAATEGCVYVLAFDEKVVAGRVARKYGFEQDEATNYLEKIVQIPFQLPPIDQEDILEFIRVEFSQMDGNERRIFAAGLGTNPRAIIRAVNTYLMVQAIAEKRVAAWEIDPLEPGLIAKWVVIQTGFKRLYGHIVDNPLALVALEKWAREESTEANETFNFGSEGDWLVSPRDQPALRAMLNEWYLKFDDPAEQRRLRWYISLSGEAVQDPNERRTETKYREPLLSGNRETIKHALKQILPGHNYTDEGLLDDWGIRIRDAYRNRLRGILGDVKRYSSAQRLSANIALEEIEGRTREPHIPETVCVTGQAYRCGGWDAWDDEEETTRARAADIDLEKLKKTPRVWEPAAAPDFRIGRYPVKNSEFEQFLKSVTGRNLVTDPRFRPGIVECEAYWRPCTPKMPHEWRSWPEQSASHSLVSFEQTRGSIEQNTPAQICPFSRDDGTQVCEITVSKLTGSTLHVQLSSVSSDQKTDYSFEVNVHEGLTPTRAESKGDAAVRLQSQGSRIALETDELLVRIRMMVAGSEISKHYYVGEETIDVEISVWDRRLIVTPRLTISLETWNSKNRSPHHPVTGVTWEDAVLYCMWLKSETGVPYRLPTELEWELAASGGTYRFPGFPWGGDWDPTAANTSEAGIRGTTSVDHYPNGESPYSCSDMAGNVWEWCADAYNESFENERTGDTWQDIKIHGDPKTEKRNERSVRGGSYDENKISALCSYREGRDYHYSSPTIGFRVAISSGWEKLM